MEAMRRADEHRYRLRMSARLRYSAGAVYLLIAFVMASGLFAPDLAVEWRLLCLLGAVSGLFSARAVLGTAIVVRADGLVLQRYWPRRRFIPWYRIEFVDVLPGFWNLELRLNSGEIVELPPVRDLEDLFGRVEHHRSHLDA